MKLLRVLLLVVLAVMLPLRGAIASAMVCGPADDFSRQSVMHDADRDDHESSTLVAEHSHDDHDGASSHDHGHERCNMCSASCSSPLLPSGEVGVEEPMAMAEVFFPAPGAPAPTFMSDGQERPPRTI